MAITKQDALDYHRNGRPGKIEVVPTKSLNSQYDLSLAYSPGVAEAVLEVDRDPLTVYELTAKANLVAVVSNGTAILGLGDRGPLAAKPVMEGKGVLFKRFADVDVFDIEVNASTIDEMIAVCTAIEPTFGAINLEDIKSPECFEIETRLRERLNIPVFHDDQHGTAIITGAALINACLLTNRSIASVKVVIVGAGAAGVATGNFYEELGVPLENITMCDIHGVVYAGRELDMDEYKGRFAHKTDARAIEDALVGADVLLGVSAAGAVKPEWLASMNPSPIIFAMANPTPEIMPEVVHAVRPDAIMGTGRSDYPNQINNVLGFPFIFRGALDVYAREINEDMKLAAARALAALAHEDVPDSVLSAYGLEALKFGKDYLIPKPLDPRALLWVAPAVAKAAMESGAARRHIDIPEYVDALIDRQGAGQALRSAIMNKARRGTSKRIVFTEGEDPRIIRAAAHVVDEGIGVPILLGRRDKIYETIMELGLRFQPETLDPYVNENLPEFQEALYELRQRKGINMARARTMLRNRNYFAPMMIKKGLADVYVSGLTYEYPDVLRPALQIFGTRPETRHVCGVYIIMIKRRVYLFSDTTVNIDPDSETLCEIAILAADFAKTLDLDPQVAMLSFSNFGSTPHPFSEKVSRAVNMVRELRPDINIDGEMQADTAVVEAIVEDRYPFSRVKDANVLIFPDLGSANIAYKLLARLTKVDAIGPVLLGVGAPVQVIQAGDDVDDIVALSAFAAVDAQSRESRGY